MDLFLLLLRCHWSNQHGLLLIPNHLNIHHQSIHKKYYLLLEESV